jgi:sporulation protein YlmC with PRC-barrel domain
MEQGLATAGQREVVRATKLSGNSVRNQAGEKLGKVKDVMLDVITGDVAYNVLDAEHKYFAVPWSAMTLNQADNEFLLDIEKDDLKNAPGFDKDNWPDMADPTFGASVHNYYGREPYYNRTPDIRVDESSSPAEDAAVVRERANQPDLPEELRRRPIDVTNFPGREADADLKSADPSRTYAVNDTNRWTRK